MAGNRRGARSGAAALLAIVVTAVGAVTAGDAPASPRAEPSAAAVVTMTDDDEFTPETVTVHLGETVLFKNTSKRVHTVTADPKLAKDPKHVELPAGAAPFDSGKLKSGDSYRHAFEALGRYTYFCIPHERMGMIGHVVVTK
jgi:plastocyanin